VSSRTIQRNPFLKKNKTKQNKNKNKNETKQKENGSTQADMVWES
jgi:hypothetical protein